jgi:hypothetical protein
MPVAAALVVAIAVTTVAWSRDGGGGQKSPSSRSDDSKQSSSLPRLAPESSVCQGLLHVPDPGQARVFPAEYTQRREATGLTIVADADVDPKAMDIAVETVDRLFKSNDLAAPLADDGAYVIVADAKQGVLDLPEFKCMSESAANQEFFSHVCGVADRADYPVVTVNELDLLGKRSGPCAGLNILYHELGHLVQGWAIAPADYFDIHQFYQDALNAGKYQKAYAATNANEYFAEATQAYFLTVEQGSGKDRSWLKTYDPQIYELLARIYGD